ncbi:MAG: hypothetical protein FI718_08890 [SAR202 cluster bacterium]|nr:hypothetical protein [SAR202 cluster bacterium]
MNISTFKYLFSTFVLLTLFMSGCSQAQSIETSKSNPNIPPTPEITCTIDSNNNTLTCKAYPMEDDAERTWSSNIGGWSKSKLYELELQSEYQFKKDGLIQLELCNENQCIIAKYNVDTLILKPAEKPIGTSVVQNPGGNQKSNPTQKQSANKSTVDIPAKQEEPLAISCNLDKTKKTIFCSSNVVFDTGEIKWSSNIEGWRNSKNYEIQLVKDYQFIPEVRIELQKCKGNKCETVFTTVNTESLKPKSTEDNISIAEHSNDTTNKRFRGCTGSGEVQFEYSPMRFEDFSTIKPYGAVSGAHVTPIDHMYFAMADRSLGRDSYEVRAIQDGVIYNLSPRDINVDTGEAKDREWRMDIAHTCTFHSYFDLLTSLHPDILAEWEPTQGGETGPWEGIPIKSGQVVGRIGGQTLDFGVYNYETTLEGFIYPEHYSREPWKIHTVDPFPYFPEEIREIMLERNIRKVEPLSGKIDHDIDGTLSGNWFELNTNWYGGVNPSKYWSGHLSIAPDHIDPDVWIFATGYWPGARDGSGAADFLIVDPEIEPDKVGITNGIIKYNLGNLIYCFNDPTTSCMNRPDGSQKLFAKHRKENVQNIFEGVVLLQMLEDRLLKAEVFPGKTPDEIIDFTSNATVYER